MLVYSENFTSYSAGTDMLSNGWSWTQYGAETGTFLVTAEKHGEIVSGANWAGGFELDAGSAWGNYTFEFDVKSYVSGRILYGFRSCTSGAYWIQHLPGSNILRLYKASKNFIDGQVQLQDWDSVAPGSAANVKVKVENLLDGSGDVKISLWIDDVLIGTYTDSTYKLYSGSIILTGYQTGWAIDNLEVDEIATETESTNRFPITRSIFLQAANTNYLNFGNHADFDRPSLPFSMFFRYYPTDAIGALKILASNGWYGAGGFYVQLYNGQIDIIVNTSTGLRTSDIDAAAGAWTDFLITYDGAGNWKLYQKGVERSYAANNNVALISRGTLNLVLGDYHGYTPTAYYSDFQWYNRVISAAEIANLAETTPSFPANLISWWPLQEISGTTLDDRQDAHDGTLEGTTTGCYSINQYGIIYVRLIPVWETGYPSVDEITKTTAKVNFKTDIAGTAYFVCLPITASAPSSAQVKAGTDANGVAVGSGLSGNVSLTALTEAEKTISNLSAGTSYAVYSVAENEALQTEPVLVQITTTISNAIYLKRSLLRVQATVELSLNLGTTLDTAVDITKYCLNLADLSEKLTKSNFNVGGVILPNIKIKLDNSRGKFDKNGDLFKKGFINNSVIKLTTNFVDADGVAITDKFIFQGILKYASCEWDRADHIVAVTVFSATGLFASEKVENGILSATTTPTFADVIYKVLHRSPFTKYMTISTANINLAWDVTQVDQYSQMAGITVKTLLDNIMELTGSIYYVDYDQNFIVEPAIDSTPTLICTLRGDDIISVNAEEYDWKGHYTAIKWDDGENTVQKVETVYADREKYQYDYSELKLTTKYITNATNRLTILNNLLALYKYLKLQIKIACKWNPDIKVNSYVALDVEAETISGSEYFIWNESSWNDGKFWGLGSPGISFGAARYWRVIEVKRDAEGEKMELLLLQQYSDDEI